MTEKNNPEELRPSRRKLLLKTLTIGGGAVITSKSLPGKWHKPVVSGVMLPAHAKTSDPEDSEGSENSEPRTYFKFIGSFETSLVVLEDYICIEYDGTQYTATYASDFEIENQVTWVEHYTTDAPASIETEVMLKNIAPCFQNDPISYSIKVTSFTSSEVSYTLTLLDSETDESISNSHSAPLASCALPSMECTESFGLERSAPVSAKQPNIQKLRKQLFSK